MNLSDLFSAAGLPPTPFDGLVTGISADTRTLKPGMIFAALPGQKIDGSTFIDAALAAGACAVITKEASFSRRPGVIVVADPRLTLAKLATAYYAPSPPTIVAVTGTNGKTSTAHFTQQIWNLSGHRAVCIGTLGVEGNGLCEPGSLTTPDPVTLHQTLQRLAGSGITHAALEASSHGLDQYRLDGLTLKAAGFTYLGRDHLDYHGTMEAYFDAKSLLFSRVLPAHGTAVLNADIQEYEALAKLRPQHLSYGKSGHDLTLHSLTPTPAGLELSLSIMGKRHAVSVPVTGTFQGMNILCALGLAIGSDLPVDKALAALPHLDNVRGRLQQVNKQPVYVDYAHTPDALETVLKALRPHTTRRLICVFGCGGNRDKGKRPLMGQISARLADLTYVTDDNPRHENAATIRAEILSGNPQAIEIPDRAVAIHTAVAALEAGDVVVIAGKGHESGQIVGSEVQPFDDVAVARTALEDR